jgi:hypothetical protein
MDARHDGRNVVLTMTADEAAELEAELLWCRDDDKHSKDLWETLNALSGPSSGKGPS